jgi:hypothetical protein
MKKDQLIAFLESELSPVVFSLKENQIDFLHRDINLEYSQENQLDKTLFSYYQHNKNLDKNWIGVKLYFDNSGLKQFVEVVNLYLQIKKEEILDIIRIETQIYNLRFSNFQIFNDNNLVLKYKLSENLVDILLN